MKNIAKLALKGLFVAVLFTTGSVALSTAGASTVSAANATVSGNQIFEYLVSNGYTVISVEPNLATKYDWTAHTVRNGIHYTTSINCTFYRIIGTEDMPM